MMKKEALRMKKSVILRPYEIGIYCEVVAMLRLGVRTYLAVWYNCVFVFAMRQLELSNSYSSQI